MASRNEREYSIDGVVGRQSAVVDDKVTFETLWNVVATAARLDHGGQVVDVDNGAEVAGLLQTVEAFHLDQLTKQLIGNLNKKTKEVSCPYLTGTFIRVIFHGAFKRFKCNLSGKVGELINLGMLRFIVEQIVDFSFDSNFQMTYNSLMNVNQST
jgi:hypothetical protein